MTVDEITLLAFAPISAVIFSLYAYRVYSLKIPSDNYIRKSKYGDFGSLLMRQVRIFIWIGPAILALGFTSTAIYSITNKSIFLNASIVLCAIGVLLVWLCVSWDILAK